MTTLLVSGEELDVEEKYSETLFEKTSIRFVWTRHKRHGYEFSMCKS